MRRLRQRSHGLVITPTTHQTHQTRPNTEHLIQNSIRYNEPITKYQRLFRNTGPDTKYDMPLQVPFHIQWHISCSSLLLLQYQLRATKFWVEFWEENFLWEKWEKWEKTTFNNADETDLPSPQSLHSLNLRCDMLMISGFV